MKRIAVSVVMLFAVSLTPAQSQPAATTPGATPAAVKPADPKAAPAAKKDDKKKEPEYKIAGVAIPRANGTFLGLEVVGANFKLSFYDKKKKPMPVNVTRATARWPNTRSATVAFNKTVLNPGGGTFLVGAKPVLPPYAWNVYITLLQGDGDEAKAVESYVVPFHG
jgi:hypothetical protein